MSPRRGLPKAGQRLAMGDCGGADNYKTSTEVNRVLSTAFPLLSYFYPPDSVADHRVCMGVFVLFGCLMCVFGVVCAIHDCVGVCVCVCCVPLCTGLVVLLWYLVCWEVCVCLCVGTDSSFCWCVCGC